MAYRPPRPVSSLPLPRRSWWYPPGTRGRREHTCVNGAVQFPVTPYFLSGIVGFELRDAFRRVMRLPNIAPQPLSMQLKFNLWIMRRQWHGSIAAFVCDFDLHVKSESHFGAAQRPGGN